MYLVREFGSGSLICFLMIFPLFFHVQEKYYRMSTDHPDIAYMLRREDQWLQELTSSSVVAMPVGSSADVASDWSDDDVYVVRGANGYNTGVASWSQPPPSPFSDLSQDAISESEPMLEPTPTLADDGIKGPLKAVSQRPKRHKYGYCSDHRKAFKLHLVKTGPHAGLFWCRCEKFWHRGSDGRPECWRGHPYRGAVDALPRSAVRMQARMRRDLKFQLQHGPQTRPF